MLAGLLTLGVLAFWAAFWIGLSWLWKLRGPNHNRTGS